jgi:hypothetical protein
MWRRVRSLEAVVAAFDGRAGMPYRAVRVLQVQQRVDNLQVGGAEWEFADRLVEPDSRRIVDTGLEFISKRAAGREVFRNRRVPFVCINRRTAATIERLHYGRRHRADRAINRPVVL